jgi:hypothetical protein
MTYMADPSPLWTFVLKQKMVEIESIFLYREVKIKVRYRYLLSSDGESVSDFSKIPQDEGLYIFVSGAVNEHELENFEEFSVINVQKAELKEQIERYLVNFLDYWVDNYADSRFKHDDFGTYEIGDKIHFSDDDRMKELIKRFKNIGVSHQETGRLVTDSDKTRLENKLEKLSNKPDFAHLMMTSCSC